MLVSHGKASGTSSINNSAIHKNKHPQNPKKLEWSTKVHSGSGVVVSGIPIVYLVKFIKILEAVCPPNVTFGFVTFLSGN